MDRVLALHGRKSRVRLPPGAHIRTILPMQAKHYKHNEDGRTAPGVYGNGSVPLSHSGNVVMRIGIHTGRL